MERVSDRQTARRAYATFVKRWPEHLNGAIALANADYGLGDLPQAESVLRAATLRHPKSVVALNNLAQVVSDRDRPAEALELIDEAIALGGPFMVHAQETRQQIMQKLQAARP